MDRQNEDQLILELRRDEGVKDSPYKDSVGVLTVGVGHNMESSPLPDYWKFPLSDARVNSLLREDMQNVYKALDDNLPWWRTMNYVRQRVIFNMCFNLGITKLMAFRNTLVFMKDRKYSAAASEMLNSKWAKQVGDRATRLATMMRNGV